MQKNSRRGDRRFFVALALGLTGIAIGALVIGFAWLQTQNLYARLKNPGRGWKLSPFRADSELGYSYVPGIVTAHTFPIGPDVPARISPEGFRVPAEDQSPANEGPVVLALGCSFTYGDGVRAEDTFVYRLAQALHGRAVNAGVCGFGLAQMALTAERVIPKVKADYVVLQYSDWLWHRAVNQRAVTTHGTIPTPYIVDAEGGEFAVQPPTYVTNLLSRPLDYYKTSPAGFRDRISFLFEVALPNVLHDQPLEAWALLRSSLKLARRPSRRPGQGIEYFYRRMAELARQNGAKPIILKLGRHTGGMPDVPGAIVVDAERALWDALPVHQDVEYQRQYQIWREGRRVDTHPSPLAHQRIAEAIGEAIRKSASPNRDLSSH